MRSKLNSRGGDYHSVPGTYDGETGEDMQLIDDEDTCGVEELENLFQVKCRIGNELAVSLNNDYILHLAADSCFTRVAAGLSNAIVHIFDVNVERAFQISSVTSVSTPTSNERVGICGVRFLDDTPNCLLVGENNGIVRLYDLRTQREQARFQENIECTDNFSYYGRGRGTSMRKAINCFDSNSNGRIICTGTEQYQGDTYLLFYDVRQREHLGGYFESHEDDITSLRFHDKNPDILCSGSVDGLINVFDIKEETEDDALTATINTECSIQKLNWHRNIYEQYVISCVTDTNDFHVYLAEEGDVVAKFDRAQITAAAKRKNKDNCNVVDAHSNGNGDLLLLTGTNNKGEVLRTLRLNKNLLPMADFIGTKQVVRASVYDKKSGALVTGGESGFVTLWTTEGSQKEDGGLASSSSEFKHKNKKSKKKTPY
ncbi:PREDICTED: WD repeat-containing protein 89 [Bactrocera latifrons]|uniref:WD repeat-containing protein 89 n=1 Tax=Bactrocera latifrons TaxID=174628 RepID=UPI0008DD46EF|nr:PREDICTED: WD repeat-containing protein 89 [Bactrocera latifrons]